MHVEVNCQFEVSEGHTQAVVASAPCGKRSIRVIHGSLSRFVPGSFFCFPNDAEQSNFAIPLS